MADATSRKKYTSDVTDEQWSLIESVESVETRTENRGVRRRVSLREVVNTIFYINRSGCQWDRLPHNLVPKSTVYDYFVKWRSESMIKISHIGIMLRRLAPTQTPAFNYRTAKA